MSNFVRFYFDRNNKLNYSALIEEEADFGKGIDAEHILSKLDCYKYQNYKIAGDNLILYNKHFSLILENYKYYKHIESILKPGHNLWSVCPKINSSLALTMRNKKEKKKKMRKKIERTATAVFLSSIVAMSLISGIKISKGFDKAQELPKTDEIKIEMQVENDNINYHDALLDDYIIDDNYDASIQDIQTEEKSNILVVDGSRDLTQSEKAIYARENWYDVIKELADTYGISANLPMAILTQETGGFEEYKDNIMQIEFHAWEDQVIKCYNFKTNETEEFVLSNNPEKYGDNVIVYTQKDLKDPIKNMEAGVRITRNVAVNQNYNIFLGLFTYNMGYGNMNKIIDEYLDVTGYYTKNDVLNDHTHINGLIDAAQYTVNVGDYQYPLHVINYLEGDEVWIAKPGENPERVYQQFSHEKGLS